MTDAMKSTVNKPNPALSGKRRAIRKTPAEKVLYAIVFFIFCLFAVSYVYMIFWCFYSGLRTADDAVVNPFGFSSVHFGNYIKVFSELKVNDSDFFDMLLNSLYFSCLGSALNILITTMFAYVCAKYRFFGSKLIYSVVIVVTTLPIFGSGSATYKLLYNLGFLNSRLMILTSLGGFSMNFLYMYAFFRGVSDTYAEAAEIDGANDWQIFFKVMLPQSMAMAGSLFIILWMAEWNSYGTALIYLNKMPTLAVGIYLFQTHMMYKSSMNILYAACFISLLPPLLIFITCNGMLMSNVSLGGIKE
ncbi:MAG: carbohydrate ABC transporter permease [Candidatus Borkfalkiaceae bacterium]|nr:carbohydrate ABC transporter permease [Christensenellaceae bacterium]